MKFSPLETLLFLKNIFDYNPKAFTEHQTLALLVRIALIAIAGLNNGQQENSLEVL